MGVSKSLRSLELGRGQKHYMPGLDGLRALSVLAVIAYHLNFPWAQGGFLGVSIFFTLSGYLITDQLIMQWQNTREISLKDFWIRRARRLLPALFFMLATVCLYLGWLDSARLMSLKDDLLSVVFYYNNWWLIFHNVSYFESFGPLSPIGHLWSLAIEEQFYILWPVVLIVGLKLFRRRRMLILITLLGTIASVLAMGMIYEPGIDPSRVYYGTDTRVFALLLGAAFAFVFPSRKMPQKISNSSRLILDIIGGASLIGVLWMIGITNEYDESLYRGGLAFFVFLSAIVTVVLAHPASRIARFMGNPSLRWVGLRSYSLYLWHYPVITLTSPSVNTEGFDGSQIFLQLALTFLLAAFSWKFIEEPIRQGTWHSFWRNTVKGSRRLANIGVLTTLILLITSCTSPQRVEERVLGNPEQKAETVQNETFPQGDNASIEEDAVTTVGESIGEPSQEEAEILSQSKEGKGITTIGDSVILDAAPYLEKLYPGIIVDGKVGRQMAEAQNVVNELKNKGQLGDTVIIELGSNGPFNPNVLRQLLISLGEEKHMILVNVHVPRKWQDTVNEDLNRIAAEFSNVTLVDWYSASKGKEAFFTPDGVHLKEEGAKYYAELIGKAIETEER